MHVTVSMLCGRMFRVQGAARSLGESFCGVFGQDRRCTYLAKGLKEGIAGSVPVTQVSRVTQADRPAYSSIGLTCIADAAFYNSMQWNADAYSLSKMADRRQERENGRAKAQNEAQDRVQRLQAKMLYAKRALYFIFCRPHWPEDPPALLAGGAAIVGFGGVAAMGIISFGGSDRGQEPAVEEELWKNVGEGCEGDVAVARRKRRGFCKANGIWELSSYVSAVVGLP